MIEYIEGDIFSSPAQTIVNTVNTLGVMGKGIALEFKKRYPQMFDVYKLACEKHQLTIGKLMLIPAPDHLILLFPTKENWRFPSKLTYIEQGLKRFCDHYAQRGITSIAFPKLGCGNGELSWDDVKPLMEKYLKELPINIYIYLRNNIEEPEHKKITEMQKWLRENAKDMSFNGVFDDIRQQCTLVPYEFYIENEKVAVSYCGNDLHFEFQNNSFEIHEEEFFTAWDEIRNKSIFLVDKERVNYYLLCNLLLTLGYLSKIRKLDKNTNSMKNGFQLNEGLGRAYMLNGVRK